MDTNRQGWICPRLKLIQVDMLRQFACSTVSVLVLPTFSPSTVCHCGHTRVNDKRKDGVISKIMTKKNYRIDIKFYFVLLFFGAFSSILHGNGAGRVSAPRRSTSPRTAPDQTPTSRRQRTSCPWCCRTGAEGCSISPQPLRREFKVRSLIPPQGLKLLLAFYASLTVCSTYSEPSLGSFRLRGGGGTLFPISLSLRN